MLESKLMYVINYLKESYLEFKKVKWPTKDETRRLTVYVIAVSLGIGAYLGLLDYGFIQALAIIL